MFQETSMTIHS